MKKIRDFMWVGLRQYTLPEADLNLVVLAIDEVCSNLMIHSHFCNPDDILELHIQALDSEFICDIFDQGEGFNIGSYDEPPLDSLIRDRRAGGMGLMLVKRIMDSVEWESLGERNRYSLRKQMAGTKQQGAS